MTTAYLSGITFAEGGYLLLLDNPDQRNDNPFVLQSVEQLWLKFHPHLDAIDFEIQKEGEEPSSPTKELPPLEKLERFSDMVNKLIPVIEDIDGMRDRERFLSRKQRDERELRIMEAERTSKGKVNSLEREQEARLKTKEENEIQDIDYTNATLRVVKTINSIRLIYPVLVNMLVHEFQADTELKIKKETIANKTTKRWLLCDYVFDVGSSKNFQSIGGLMSHVLGALLPPDEVTEFMKGDGAWKDLAKRCMARIDVPKCAPNPLLLLPLNEDLLNKARRHDEAMMNYIGEGRMDHSQTAFGRAVNNLKRKLDVVLGKRFQGCRLEVYGSCLSDLSIGKASDVDVSIDIPALNSAKIRFEKGSLTASRYEKELKRHVYMVERALKDLRRDFYNTQAVARARVPVVKGCYRFAENPHTQDGSLCFDICFFNDIAVRNSTLLRDYTKVDSRSKDLMLAIKKWAKENKICSAADERLSSYAWVILVIFYLQQIGLLPNLQCEDLMKTAGFELDTSASSLHRVNALNTAFVPWKLVEATNAWQQPEDLKDIPVSVLLHGFFNFLTNFPSAFYAISIRKRDIFIPKSSAKKCSLSFLCIEDPFETFISHRPHDLAGPASMRGQIQIRKLLAEGAEHARAVLLNKVEVEDGEMWRRSGNVKKQLEREKDDDRRQAHNQDRKDGAKKQSQQLQKTNRKQRRAEAFNGQSQKQQDLASAVADKARNNAIIDLVVSVPAAVKDGSVKHKIDGAGGHKKYGKKQQPRGQNQNRQRNKNANQRGANDDNATENVKRSGKKYHAAKPKKAGNKQQPQANTGNAT